MNRNLSGVIKNFVFWRWTTYSYGFWMTWGLSNDDNIFVWTLPLTFKDYTLKLKCNTDANTAGLRPVTNFWTTEPREEREKE